MDEIAKPRFAAAMARGDALMKGPRADAVIYDAHRNRIVVTLTTGIEIGFAPEHAQGLQAATPSDLRRVELDAMGLGIHFPRLR